MELQTRTNMKILLNLAKLVVLITNSYKYEDPAQPSQTCGVN